MLENAPRVLSAAAAVGVQVRLAGGNLLRLVGRSSGQKASRKSVQGWGRTLVAPRQHEIHQGKFFSYSFRNVMRLVEIITGNRNIKFVKRWPAI